MTLLPCAGVLCPLLSDPLTWQLHGVLKHLAQQAMSNNCCYKHVTKNLKSHTENSKNSKPCRKEKKNTAQRLTLKLPQGKTSSQTCMADLNSHSLLCQHAGSSGRANYCPLVCLGKFWFFKIRLGWTGRAPEAQLYLQDREHWDLSCIISI